MKTFRSARALLLLSFFSCATQQFCLRLHHFDSFQYILCVCVYAKHVCIVVSWGQRATLGILLVCPICIRSMRKGTTFYEVVFLLVRSFIDEFVSCPDLSHFISLRYAYRFVRPSFWFMVNERDPSKGKKVSTMGSFANAPRTLY